MTAEQRELTRQCAQRIIDNHNAGRVVDQHSLQWARQFVLACKPLGRPVGTGAPA